MTRFRFRFLALFAAVVAAASMTSVAFAGDGNNGNGATTATFNASYSYFVFGQNGIFNCSETRIVKTAPNAFTKDSATCQVTGDFTPGTYPAAGNWVSDYEYFINPGGGAWRPALSGNIVITSNGDGTTTWLVTAYY